ncbi:hypothetical protein [Halorarius halobius]|uniref:hypothetical protein n=1 Tax=Halorarius halobius TaxID=2962671 RepID=UPI0020CBC446|nr:hypothetical protein [Halorarius halobius]
MDSWPERVTAEQATAMLANTECMRPVLSERPHDGIRRLERVVRERDRRVFIVIERKLGIEVDRLRR